MLSKEEIREKHLKKNGLAVTQSSVGTSINKAAYGAMDEYAKQVAIDFAEWISEWRWCMESPGKWYQGIFYETKYSTEQVFNLYTESKKQQP